MGISGLIRGTRDDPDVGLIPTRASAARASLRETAATEDILARFPGMTAPGTEELRFLAFDGNGGIGRRGPIAL